MKCKLAADYNGLGEALKVIKEKLNYYKIDSRDIEKNLLASEEIMHVLLDHSEKAEHIYLSVRRVFDEVSIEISVPGKEIHPEKEIDPGKSICIDDIGPNTERIIRSMILKSFKSNLKYRYRDGMNTVRISAIRFKRAMLYITLGVMLLAIVLGFLGKSFVPQSICLSVNDNILIPVKLMYMDALKLIVAPVVFFSIISCIGQLSDLSEIGKIGGKTITLYGFTTIIATLLGTGMFYLFQPGVFGSLVFESTETVIETQTINTSFKDIIVNIVPDNFIKPFLESNMLQLIFLAVLCGIAVGMIGKYSRILNDLFTACNELFLKITSLIIKFLPLAVFCGILSMILKTGTDSLISILGIAGVFIVSIVLMMFVCCVLILLFTRLNPVHFIKKYAPTMMQVFSISSSNASLPLNFEACKKLGISQKVYSLSLPLGATINMNGTCIYLSIFSLALAKLCGIEISSIALISVWISIIVLSVGAPGIPGSGMVCLSVLLAQLNVPLEAVALVMGIDPIMGMIRCTGNCLGDVAISTIVAKQEGILDIDTYRSP